MFFLRSPLNFPWILKIGVRKEVAFSTLSLQGQWYGKRLSKKLRKRLCFRKALQWYSHKSLTRETLWLYLHRLTQDDLQCFELTEELRSNRFSLEQCYYLLRLARLLDDPPKSRVVSTKRYCSKAVSSHQKIVLFASLSCPIPFLEKLCAAGFVAWSADPATTSRLSTCPEVMWYLRLYHR